MRKKDFVLPNFGNKYFSRIDSKLTYKLKEKKRN